MEWKSFTKLLRQGTFRCRIMAIWLGWARSATARTPLSAIATCRCGSFIEVVRPEHGSRHASGKAGPPRCEDIVRRRHRRWPPPEIQPWPGNRSEEHTSELQ